VHCAQKIATEILVGSAANAVGKRNLTLVEARRLSESLRTDAVHAMYSGAHSIAEAIQGLDKHLYSWATIKLYYSLFYFLRASLGLRGIALVYWNQKPYTWKAAQGNVPAKQAGNSHTAVMNAFKQHQSTSILLSQQIGSENSLEWLKSQRESVNYKVLKFCEPNAPFHFKFVSRHGVRKLVGLYFADTDYHYTFDPDHAMLAFPLLAFKLLINEIKTSGIVGLDDEDARHLASLFLDSRGPLSDFRNLLFPT
jgi:hypothetical protein